MSRLFCFILNTFHSCYKQVPERIVAEALVIVLSATLDKTEADRELALALIAALRKESLVINSQVHYLHSYIIHMIGTQFSASCG